MGILLLVCAGAWLVVGLLAPIPVGAPRLLTYVLLMAATYAALGVWLRSWFIVLDRVHARLLARPNLGDAPRLASLAAVFVGYPLVSLLVVVVLLFGLGRLTAVG
jgi:hypothetical protein